MVRTGTGLGLALLVLVVLLASLDLLLDLTPPSLGTGLGSGIIALAVVGRATGRTHHTPGPADLVTLGRAMLVCAVAAVATHSLVSAPAIPTLVALAVMALALDAVDGWAARRTVSASAFGARFDGEVDAFLILVLSVFVAASVGPWVLAIGGARYAFGAAGWALAWMRRTLPPRYWRKVVAVGQCLALIVATADVLPDRSTQTALAVALALLAESFGHDVWWLWRRRHDEPPRPALLSDAAVPVGTALP